jgi:hypothetical protein
MTKRRTVEALMVILATAIALSVALNVSCKEKNVKIRLYSSDRIYCILDKYPNSIGFVTRQPIIDVEYVPECR